MRGCLWLEPQGKLVPFASAVFEAYWAREEDISKDVVLSKVCQQIGVDDEELSRVPEKYQLAEGHRRHYRDWSASMPSALQSSAPCPAAMS